MNQPAKAQEPSMEEILASIRRIIADDDANRPPPPAAAAAKPVPATPPPAPRAAAPPPKPMSPPPAPPSRRQAEIDAMLNELSAAASHASPPPSPEPDPPAADVLDLTEDMATAAPPQQASPPPAFRTIDAQSDVIFEDSGSIPPPVEDMPRQVSEIERSLISSSTSAAVDSAFNTLAHTVLVQNARTLEDLVREMLRPMLKAWLDDNLPGLVERLVRAEIERVSRGRS